MRDGYQLNQRAMEILETKFSREDLVDHIIKSMNEFDLEHFIEEFKDQPDVNEE